MLSAPREAKSAPFINVSGGATNPCSLLIAFAFQAFRGHFGCDIEDRKNGLKITPPAKGNARWHWARDAFFVFVRVVLIFYNVMHMLTALYQPKEGCLGLQELLRYVHMYVC